MKIENEIKPISELFFTQNEQDQIVSSIKDAEKNTSGEIKVHVEKKCPSKDVMDRAKVVFNNLKLQETKLRNGVLFYLSIEDHKFAILGDSGIHNEVGIEFWQEIKEHSIKLFKENRFVEGLKDGITKAGEQLKNHFPYNQEDINEISDEISFGND